MNKLGFYIQNSQGTHEHISNVQPPVILMHAWDQGLLQEIRRFRAPDAFVIGRMEYIGQGGDKHPVDQSLVNAWLDGPDPAARGREFAEHILADNFQLARRKGENGRLLVDAWMSLNESIPGPASGGYSNSAGEKEEIERRLRAYDKFQVAFRNKLMEQGVEAVAFNFGAGNFTSAAHYADFFPETLVSYTYLGFHEYGWPAMRPDPAAGIFSSAGSYRPIVNALRQQTGRAYKAIITEAGLARMFAHSKDGAGDVGWLYPDDSISQDDYWRSLDWFNDYLVQDDFALGACLFQVGVGAGWQTFRHSGPDTQSRPIQILDRVRQLRDKNDHKPQPTVGAVGMPVTPPLVTPPVAPPPVIVAPIAPPAQTDPIGTAALSAQARIPRIYTNQQAIDAVFNAAGKVGLADPWALLVKAGQDVAILALDRSGRYAGPALDETPSLTANERSTLRQELLAQLVKTMRWQGLVTATDGLSLRVGPGAEHARIRFLVHEEAVQVLDDSGGWLFALAGDAPGYVSSQWVMRQIAPAPTPPAPTGNVVGLLRAWTCHQRLLTSEAGRLGIDPAVAVAVLLAESGGDGFGPDGRLKIRFENHIFLQQWGAQNRPVFDRFFAFNEQEQWKGHLWRSNKDGEWQPCHTNQTQEWQVLDFARNFIEEPALKSISMGAPQIMGFNFAALGYASPKAMFDAFQAGEETQIRGLFRFIESKRLITSLRQGDYVAFARGYNGPGQAEFYAGIIREYIDLFAREIGAGRGIRSAQPAMAAPSTRDIAEQPSVGERLPVPESGGTLAQTDPQLYSFWRLHMQKGFENNQTMFDQVLKGFMSPYWTTVWMYRILFAVGILAFVAAIAMAYVSRDNPTTAIGTAAVFGGLSIASFLSYFLSRPLQALEENLQFITWLGILYNSYWTRLAYLSDNATVQEGLEEVTNDTIAGIKELLATHAERTGKRPGAG